MALKKQTDLFWRGSLGRECRQPLALVLQLQGNRFFQQPLSLGQDPKSQMRPQLRQQLDFSPVRPSEEGPANSDLDF